MFRKLIRKKYFRTILAQLRGAKILRERDDPFFVVDTVSSLTDVPLGLQENDFPKILVGYHSRIAEILLRQIFLSNYSKICSAVMQSIGSGKPFSIPLPSAWRKHLAENGVPSSAFYCRALLFLSMLRHIAVGFVKSLILFSPFKKPRYPDCPYVVFINLLQQDLPIHGDGKSYDIISWYKESIIRKPHIGKIWAQAKVGKEYVAPVDLVVAQSMFPKLGSLSGYFRFFFRNTFALFVAVFGVFMGKWWYGLLYHESVFYNYLCSLNTDQLADDYFFSNSSWFYKPLWAHEAERKGLTVSLYSYSINMYKFWRPEPIEPDTYGCKIMLWNNFIVWDKQQEYFWKKYCPRAVFTLVDYIYQTGLFYNHTPNDGKKILSIFDVTPMRSTKYTTWGYATAPYSEEMNLSFLENIIDVFKDSSWEILWKGKRVVDHNFVSNAFIRKRLNLIDGRVKKIDEMAAALSIIEVSDAVISMPFTSPSLIAKLKGIPSVFYDSSELVKKTECHGLPVLKSREELKEWFESLSVNHTVVSCV